VQITKEQEAPPRKFVFGETKAGQRAEEDGHRDVDQRQQRAVEKIPPERREFGRLAKSREPLKIVRQPVDRDGLHFRLGLEGGGDHEPDRKREHGGRQGRANKPHQTRPPTTPHGD
jgi:hypothetical protein